MREGTHRTRTFWWDRARPVDADVCPLRAVIFDVHALADIEPDGDVEPRAGLIDLVMSLFVAGIWVGVVSSGRRTWVEPLVRQLVGDGLVETIVTRDDVAAAEPGSEYYALALWELGIAPENALAVTGSVAGLRAAAAAGLATVAVPHGHAVGREFTHDFTGAAEVRPSYEPSYEGADPMLAGGCRRVHRRWWVAKKRAA
jgi:beta-phosphoglucomutase-like phosphatase (HAD superfamily)